MPQYDCRSVLPVAPYVLPVQSGQDLLVGVLRLIICTRRADDQHCPRTSLVCIESSHNRCGGCALSLEYMRSLKSWADDLVRLQAALSCAQHTI